MDEKTIQASAPSLAALGNSFQPTSEQTTAMFDVFEKLETQREQQQPGMATHLYGSPQPAAPQQAEAAPQTQATGNPPQDTNTQSGAPQGGDDLRQTPEYQRAVDTLVRSMPKELGDLRQKTIDAMSPSDVLTKAAALGEVQASKDTEGNQLDRIMERLEAIEGGGGRKKATETEEGGGDAAQPSAEGGTLDLSEALADIDTDLYDGLPGALTKVTDTILAHVQRTYSAELQSMQDSFTGFVEDTVRRQLGKSHPLLQDDAQFDRARALASALESMDPEAGKLPVWQRKASFLAKAAGVLAAEGGASSAPKPRQTASEGNPPPANRTQERRQTNPNGDDALRAWLGEFETSGNANAAGRAAGFF